MRDRELLQASFLANVSEAVESLAISPDGKTSVSGDRAGAVTIWDIESREVRSRL